MPLCNDIIKMTSVEGQILSWNKNAMFGQSGPLLTENKCDKYFSLVKCADCPLDICFHEGLCKLIFLQLFLMFFCSKSYLS